MTEKQFWMKIDKLAGRKENLPAFVQILRQAYDEDLMIPCGVHRHAGDIYQQMYVNLDESTPNRNGNRYMLCYTSIQLAAIDRNLPEPWEALPIRFVIDNAMNKPVIGGLVFNRNDTSKIMIVPKQFLGSLETLIKTMNSAGKKYAEGGPDPFIFND